MSWSIYDQEESDDGMVHVVPDDDAIDHTLSLSCECGVRMDPDDPIVIHRFVGEGGRMTLPYDYSRPEKPR